MAENIKQEDYGHADNKQDMRNNRRNNNNNNRGDRMDKRDNRGPPGRNQNDNQWARKDFVKEKLESMSGPTTNLTSKETVSAKKFTGRCRLFVGNLPTSISEEEFRKMFKEFGELGEVFLNKLKGFGFVNLDTRQNAENAKAALDFTMKDGRQLRVRFATHGAALKIKNLSPWISNELLEASFSVFGDVERAVVIVDDRGRPVGEGIVEYARKQSAQMALKRCTDGCYLLTSSPRPVVVEPLEHRDEEDGLPEKNFQKSNKQYLKEREIGPRLAEPGTFEFEFANRWKRLYELEQQKRDHLEKEIEEGRRALDDQMEFAIYDHEANLLRERLRHMEEQSTMIQRERELRREEEMRREEARRQQEMILRQQQEEILRNDLRRRQEENMMMSGGGYGDLMDRDPMRKMPPGPMSPAMPGDPSSAAGYGNGMMQGAGMGHPPTKYLEVLKVVKKRLCNICPVNSSRKVFCFCRKKFEIHNKKSKICINHYHISFESLSKKASYNLNECMLSSVLYNLNCYAIGNCFGSICVYYNKNFINYLIFFCIFIQQFIICELLCYLIKVLDAKSIWTSSKEVIWHVIQLCS